MVQTRREAKKAKKAKEIPLKQPDRSAPSEKTLLDFANDRDLFAQAEARTRANKRAAQGLPVEDEDDDETDDDEGKLSPGAERFMEALLWTVTMAMMHMTFDVLVQHQYGMEIDWPQITIRTIQAWIVFLILFYPLHPHEANKRLVPGLGLKYQPVLFQILFFVASIVAGCYLIHISNTYSYLAVMKQAPPIGVIWIWSVIELDLLWAAGSLSFAAAFLWLKGYSVY